MLSPQCHQAMDAPETASLLTAVGDRLKRMATGVDDRAAAMSTRRCRLNERGVKCELEKINKEFKYEIIRVVWLRYARL